MSERLSKRDWIAHGLRALASEGPEALRAGPMCDALGVSRGSFYWHFKSVGDFHTQLLDAWENRNTDAVIRGLGTPKPEPDQLLTLMQSGFGVKQPLDQAMRIWAARDLSVRDRVDRIDHIRMETIARLLETAGLATELARQRAVFLYWAVVGHSMTRPLLSDRDGQLAALLDDLVELVTIPGGHAERADGAGKS